MSSYASVIICINPAGEVLILKRSAALDTYPNHWCFPGGRIDPGEEPEEAAIRELKEETSLVAKEKDLVYFYTLNKKNKDILFFILSDWNGEVVIDWESSDFRWLPPSEIRNPLEELYKEDFLPTPSIVLDLIELWIDQNN